METYRSRLDSSVWTFKIFSFKFLNLLQVVFRCVVHYNTNKLFALDGNS